MPNLRNALEAELEFFCATSISTISPSKSILVSSSARDGSILEEISVIHLAIALLSGRLASQDNRFNFMFFYKGKKLLGSKYGCSQLEVLRPNSFKVSKSRTPNVRLLFL